MGTVTPIASNAIRLPVSVCPYFPDGEFQSAPSVFLQNTDISPAECDALLSQGWRHFGKQYFRNDCPGCQRCMPIRIPVMEIALSHSQRRLIRKSTALVSRFFTPAEFSERYFFEALEIHNAFTQTRYGARSLSPHEFFASFFSSPAPLIIHGIFTSDETLIACGWLDAGETALSSIYFSWSPEAAKHSLGTLSMLREALFARETGRTWYHLGYWIREHHSMAYKAILRPYQLLDFGTLTWSPHSLTEITPRHSSP